MRRGWRTTVRPVGSCRHPRDTVPTDATIARRPQHTTERLLQRKPRILIAEDDFLVGREVRRLAEEAAVLDIYRDALGMGR